MKKAQQKRLLGDVAIEGGNFTTAFFKKEALHELFGLTCLTSAENEAEKSELNEKEENIESMDTNSVPDALEAQFEQALCTAEEDTDVAAAKTARAEASAEFAEFDESIPLDFDGKEKEDKSIEEEELDQIIKQVGHFRF